MRRLDLVEERQKVDCEICRQYQMKLIRDISNISMGNRDPSLILLDKIKSCFKEAKAKVLEFERSRFGRAYRINCDVSEREQFVKLVEVHNSDYIRKLYEVWNDTYYGNDTLVKVKLYYLARKIVT